MILSFTAEFSPLAAVLARSISALRARKDTEGGLAENSGDALNDETTVNEIRKIVRRYDRGGNMLKSRRMCDAADDGRNDQNQ